MPVLKQCIESLTHPGRPALAWIVAISLQIAACAHPIQPGISTEADVLSFFGPPVDTRLLDDGSTEWDYPRGPLGRETWRVSISKAGQVQSVEQILDPKYFSRMKPGITRDEVHAVLGRHAQTTVFNNLGEEVWSWRYTEPGGARYFFNAHLDLTNGRLKYTSRTPELILEPRVRGWR